MSNDGDHSLTSSRVFCDMIETGSGEKHIELDETATTIDQFLDLVTTGSTSFVATKGASPDYAQAVRLVSFLRKFECQPAIGYLNQFVKAPSKSQDVNHLRLLTAMHLGLPETCAELVDNEPALFQWLHPATRKDTLLKQLPYEVFQLIPQRYLWALMAAGIHEESLVQVYVKSARKIVRMGPSQRFLHFLEDGA